MMIMMIIIIINDVVADYLRLLDSCEGEGEWGRGEMGEPESKPDLNVF